MANIRANKPTVIPPADCNFLSCKSIQWTLPASYYPKYWDGFLKDPTIPDESSQTTTASSSSFSSSSSLGGEMQIEGLDEFISRYRNRFYSILLYTPYISIIYKTKYTILIIFNNYSNIM